MRIALLLSASLLFACADDPSAPPEGPHCAEAATHLDACFPGMESAQLTDECTPEEDAHAQWILDRSCDQLFTDIGDGKADGVPALQGVKIRKEGNLTYFSIPLARTSQSDRGYLFDKMISQFQTKMADINQKMIANGVDMSGVLTGSLATEYLGAYRTTIETVTGANTNDNVAVALGETIQNPTKLSLWQRYVIPQAFVAYFSARFSANLGIGAGFSATVMIVVQPWLTIAVDHTLAQPKVVGKTYEVDVDIIGVPNVDLGIGAGGGAQLRLGVGAVFGPLDQPRQLAGTGIGLSGSGTIPVLGGIAGKFITILKYPPLFLVMVGYSSGTAAEVELHGNLQQLLSLQDFLAWIKTFTGP